MWFDNFAVSLINWGEPCRRAVTYSWRPHKRVAAKIRMAEIFGIALTIPLSLVFDLPVVLLFQATIVLFWAVASFLILYHFKRFFFIADKNVSHVYAVFVGSIGASMMLAMTYLGFVLNDGFGGSLAERLFSAMLSGFLTMGLGDALLRISYHLYAFFFGNRIEYRNI